MANTDYLPPNFFLARLINPLMRRLHVVSNLSVRGRRSGRWQTVPVLPVRVESQWYLVAPRGQTDWVKNLRAHPQATLNRRRCTISITAREVFGSERTEAVRAYRRRWGWALHGQFKRLPAPEDHPTFAVIPADSQSLR